MTIANRAFWNLKQQRRQLAGTSGCGLCGVEAVEQALPDLKVLPGAPLPPVEWLDGLRQRIGAFQPLGQHCGAVHAAVFMNDKGELLLGREDIGRHNALDKLIGGLIRQKIPTAGGLAIVTSRCSLELIQKVLRAGIQTLVSLSSPTGLAVQWARRHNLNLIHLPQKKCAAGLQPSVGESSVSQHRQADQKPVPRYKPYKGPAGGWGALISVAQAWLTSDNALKNLRIMLKTNQNGGFDCPGCAWGDSPEKGMVMFCENGAKAVNWEATKRRVDAKFFAKHSVTSLLEQSDYWLEYQGRLTEPMSYDAETDRYKPISWDDAFALIARHLQRPVEPGSGRVLHLGPGQQRSGVPLSAVRARLRHQQLPRLLEHVPRGQRRGVVAKRRGRQRHRDLRRLRTRRCDFRLGPEPRHQPPADARTVARSGEARRSSGVHQPAQGAWPGALPAPAAPDRNAHQRRQADQHRVLPPGPGRRHGDHARHGEIPPAVGARRAESRRAGGVRPRFPQ